MGPVRLAAGARGRDMPGYLTAKNANPIASIPKTSMKRCCDILIYMLVLRDSKEKSQILRINCHTVGVLIMFQISRPLVFLTGQG